MILPLQAPTPAFVVAASKAPVVWQATVGASAFLALPAVAVSPIPSLFLGPLPVFPTYLIIEVLPNLSSLTEINYQYTTWARYGLS